MINPIFLLLFLLIATSQLSTAQRQYIYSQPVDLRDGWNTNDLRSKADSTRLYSLFNQLIQQDHQLHSVLLVKDNDLILEEYFDQYNASDPHDLRSSTKSIRSLLLGVAIDKGFIENVDDPISKYLKSHEPKKNLDSRKKQITIKHLLTMSAGWDCNDWDKGSKGQEDRVYKKKDWIQYTLDLPMINDPGAVSTYCSMGAILVAEIISQASGMSIDQFAKEYLFIPLSITNTTWGHTSDKEIIPSGKRLYMTPRDMAKIGQLILDSGKWEEKQIVSAEWVEESTTTHTTITGMEYGYLWWNIPLMVNGKKIMVKTATGNGGQYIMVIPEMNIIGVFTGGAYNSQDDKLPFVIMRDVLLPSF